MRRGQKPTLIYDDDGRLIGVNLSADYCSEHEWGIKPLNQEFGLDNENLTPYGIQRRSTMNAPELLRWVEFQKEKLKYAGFVFNRHRGEIASEVYIYRPMPTKRNPNPDLSQYPTLAAAWSDDDFAVVSIDKAEIAQLKEIFDAFKAKNGVITFGGALPAFENPGLILAIADRIPQTVLDMWEKSDREHHEIRKEVVASDIEGLLKKAGKRFHALSPRRNKDGVLEFWLNPCDQDQNNFGWFKIEALREWAEGKGPVPKQR